MGDLERDLGPDADGVGGPEQLGERERELVRVVRFWKWPNWPVSPSVLPGLSLTDAGMVTFGETAFALVASAGSLPTVVTPSLFGSPPLGAKSPAPETFGFC